MQETKVLSRIPKYSHGKGNTGNLIIQGDNSQTLALLQKKYLGRIKCVYIDPPYNNGESYEHYHDKKDHSEWLKEIKMTLQLIEPLISKDGSIWISIDDSEMHYLKIAADEVFGRKNFVATIVWQQRTTRENRSVFSRNHEYILVYAKDPRKFKLSRNLLPLHDDVLSRYKNPDNDPRGPWQSVSINVQDGHATKHQFYQIKAPNGKIHLPPQGRCWALNQQNFNEHIKNNNIWFGKDGQGVPRMKKFLNGSANGLTPETLWFGNDVGTTKDAKKHLLDLFPKVDVFDTPKPEQLIKRILQIASNEGDYILDCYLGSGSTVSTAHKMKRKYIGIELGDHVVHLVSQRLKNVISGECGGITKEVNWTSGGGFDFYNLQEVRKVQTKSIPVEEYA
jgi:adenine-specific DNA-methyltransferase